MKKNEAYALAAEELSSDKKDVGLWAQVFAKASGDDGKAKSIYIRLRAKRLIREHSFTHQLLHTFAWFWCLSVIATVAGCLWITFLAEKRAYLNSDPILKTQIPERTPGPNGFVKIYRQQNPQDPLSDDDITIEMASKYPDAVSHFPDVQADLQRIRKDTLLAMAPQFKDVFNLNGIASALGRVFTAITFPTLIASISRRMSKTKLVQFISVWFVAWLLVMVAQIVMNLQTS